MRPPGSCGSRLGVLRLGFGLTPDGARQWAWLVGSIACINIVYGALSAMSQKDLKYVVERRLWPYHGDDWQSWLAARNAGRPAPLPRSAN